MVRRRINFSSDAMADFEGLLEVNRKICNQQMAEKASPTLPTNCAVLSILLPFYAVGFPFLMASAMRPSAFASAVSASSGVMPSRMDTMAGLHAKLLFSSTLRASSSDTPVEAQTMDTAR